MVPPSSRTDNSFKTMDALNYWPHSVTTHMFQIFNVNAVETSNLSSHYYTENKKRVFNLCYKSTSTKCSGGYTSYTPVMHS